jgi:hypothetical protein
MRFYDLDIDVKNYAKRIVDAGYKCPADINSVSDFVKGLKTYNLWGNVILWPLGSNQNAQSGTTVYSLSNAGNYDGTLTNGPTIEANGVHFRRTLTQYILTNLMLSGTDPCSFFIVNSTYDDGGGTSGVIILAGTRPSDMTTTVFSAVADNGSNAITSSFILDPVPAVARPANPYSSIHCFEPRSPVARVGANGGSLTSATPSPNPLGGQLQSPLYIGHAGPSLGNRGFNGFMNFFSVFLSKSVSSAEYALLHNIYKKTAGKGLGLP